MAEREAFNSAKKDRGLALSTESSPKTEAFAKADPVGGADQWGIPDVLSQVEDVFGEDILGDRGLAQEGTPEPYLPSPTYTEGPATEHVYPLVSSRDAANWKDASETPNPYITQHEIISATTGDASAYTPEEIEAEFDPLSTDSLWWAAETFDYPRSWLWQLVYAGGSLLPDETVEGDSFGDDLADLAGWMSGNFGPLTMTEGPISAIQSQNDPVYQKLWGEMGRKMYRSLSTGALYEQAQRRPGFHHDRAYATGVDFLDFTVSKELATKLSKRAINPSEKRFFKMISSDTGRLVAGLAMEIAIDPLWFLGPAKAGQVVHVGDKSYRVSKVVTSAAGAVSRQAGHIGVGSRATKQATEFVVGAAENREAIRKGFDMAADVADGQSIAHAQRATRLAELAETADKGRAVQVAQETLTAQKKVLESQAKLFAAGGDSAAQSYERTLKLIDGVEQEIRLLTYSNNPQKYLIKMSKIALKTSRAYGKDAQNIRRFIRLGEQAHQTGKAGQRARSLLAADKGIPYLVWHVPFGTKSYSIGTPSQLQSIGSKILRGDQNLATAIGKANAARRVVSGAKIEEQLLLATRAAEQGGGGLDMASALKTLTPGQNLWRLSLNLGKQPVIAKRLVWDFAAKFIGTRHFQPMIEYYNMQKEMAHYRASGAAFMNIPFIGRKIMEVKRVSPDKWDAYQKAVTGYMVKFQSRETQLVNDVQRILMYADKASKPWKAQVKDVLLPGAEKRLADLYKQTPKTDAEQKLLATSIRRLEQEIAEYKYVISNDYTNQDILNDAFDLIESGAGRFETTPWLRAVADEVDKIKMEWAEKFGLEFSEIEQALQAMARHHKGDASDARYFAEALDYNLQIFNDSETVERTVVQSMARVAEIREQKLVSEIKLYTRISDEQLADVIYGIKQISDELPYGDEVAQAIYNVLDKVLNKNKSLIDDILTYAGGAYSARSPVESLRLFAMDITGQLDHIANQIRVGKITDIPFAPVGAPTPRPIETVAATARQVEKADAEIVKLERLVAQHTAPEGYGDALVFAENAGNKGVSAADLSGLSVMRREGGSSKLSPEEGQALYGMFIKDGWLRPTKDPGGRAVYNADLADTEHFWTWSDKLQAARKNLHRAQVNRARLRGPNDPEVPRYLQQGRYVSAETPQGVVDHVLRHEYDYFPDTIRVPGMPYAVEPTMGFQSVAWAISDARHEVSVVFDIKTGQQVARWTDNNPSSVSRFGDDADDLEELTQASIDFTNWGQIHNHPGTQSALSKNHIKLLKEFGIDVKSHRFNIALSDGDAVTAIYFNSPFGAAVNPNGTVWTIHRTSSGVDSQGWGERIAGLTNKDREMLLGRHQAGSTGIDPMSLQDEERIFGKITELLDERITMLAMSEKYGGRAGVSWSEASVEALIPAITHDFKLLKDAKASGKISAKEYRKALKAKKEWWAKHVINETQKRWNSILSEAIEDVIGVRPALTTLAGRYETLAPIRAVRGDSTQASVGTVQGIEFIRKERNVTKTRIIQSLNDAHGRAILSLEELKAARTVGVGSDIRLDFATIVETTADGIRNTAANIKVGLLSKVNGRAIRGPGGKFASKGQIQGVQEDIFTRFLSWAEQNYPAGIAAVDDAGNKVAKTSKMFSDELAKQFPGIWTGNGSDIDRLRRQHLKLMRADRHLIELAENTAAGVDRARKARGVKSGVFTRQELRLQSKSIRNSRIAQSVAHLIDTASDEADAVRRVKGALDDLVTFPDSPAVVSANQSMAETIVNSVLRGDNTEVALSKGSKTAESIAKQEVETLRRKLEEATPRIEIELPKKGSKNLTTELKDWEVELWDRFNLLTKDLDSEQKMLAAMTALVDSPRVLTKETLGAEEFNKLQSRYKQLLGRRFGEVPEELAPVVAEARHLLKRYEDLYLEHGMDFVKDPEAMLRMWGVVDFVPHIGVPAESIAKGEYTTALLSREKILNLGSSLEGSLSKNLSQQRARAISGTVREINAAASNPSMTMSFDPTLLLARMMKANLKMGAQEFIFAMMHGKVIKPIRPQTVYRHELERLAEKYRLVTTESNIDTVVRGKATADEISMLDKMADSRDMVPVNQIAADMDYVPLFTQNPKALSMDILVEEGIDAWRAAGIENIGDVLKAVREHRAAFEPFAKWIREVPEIKQADNIIEILTGIKGDDFTKGVELFNPVAEKQRILGEKIRQLTDLLKKRGKTSEEIATQLAKQNKKLSLDAWNDVAAIMNERANALHLGIKVNNGQMLSTFFEQGSEMWRLYVPRGVALSMEDIFVNTNKIPEHFIVGPTYRALREINNFFKLRVTIIALAFSARNHLSNKFVQVLDTGFETLKPSVAFTAAHLYQLSMVKNKYGTIEKARTFLNAARGRKESAAVFKRRQAEAAHLAALDIRKSYDLGDGVLRTADEAIEILDKHSIIQGAHTQYVDIDRFERGIAEAMHHGMGRGAWSKIKMIPSLAEDAIIVGLPMAISGGLWPIAVPKNIGANIARFTENHARIGTFIANTRKHGNHEFAAEKVRQFLFDYGDLTAFQKVWMRMFIPFFTWTQKNLQLHTQMATENPIFYSNFNKLFMVNGPEIIEAYNQESRGETYTPVNANAPHKVKLREPHTRNLIRMPLPGHKGVYVEGLGLPLEPFMEQVSMVTDLLRPSSWRERVDGRKPHLRLLSQSHFALKAALEGPKGFGHSAFYDRPLSELVNGRVIAAEIAGIRRIPIVGELLGDVLVELTGLHVAQHYNARLGMMMDDPVVYSNANWLFGNMPWNRVLRDAAAASMAYQFSLLSTAPSELQAEARGDVDPISDHWRVLDAMTGIRLTHEDMELRRKIHDYKRKKAYMEARKRRKATRTYEIEYPREKQ